MFSVRADVAFFVTLATVSYTIRWIFFFAIALGIARAVFLTTLALLDRRYRGAQADESYSGSRASDDKPTGLYFGGQYGRFSNDSDDFDENNDFYDVVIGGLITPYFGIEGGYSDFGKLKGDFAEADLTECDFSHSNLRDANFNRANLTKADLRTARDYLLDLRDAKIKGARMSLAGAVNLVTFLGAVID